MNILNKLTIKHLKMNKKRTIVTIIGIILSTSLMVGIGLLFSSFRDFAIRDIKKYQGDYFLKIDNYPSDKINVIKENKKIDNYYYSDVYGYAEIDSKTGYKGDIVYDYMQLSNTSDVYLKTLKLKEGVYPKNSNEILLTEKTLYLKKLKLNDYITLKVSQLPANTEYIDETIKLNNVNNTKFKIVGIIKTGEISDEDYNSYVYAFVTNNLKEETSIYIKTKKAKQVYDVEKEITKKVNNASLSYEYNDNLLAFYGTTKYDNTNKFIITVMSIILGLISIGCIIVIYNSFAISVMERKKQFGLFSSIGASKRQIKKTVLFEAFIVGLIGIFLGLIFSFIGIGILLKIINNLISESMQGNLCLSVYPLFIIVPVIFMILVVFISAKVPSKMASRITPIEAIRQNDDIKINKRKIKTNKLFRKIFGISSEIALKNIKRNKKKYRVTIISLVTSIVLFLSFSSLLNYLFNGMGEYTDLTNYDISINFNNYDSMKNIDSNEYDKIIKDFNQIKHNKQVKESLTLLNQLSYNTTDLNDSFYNTSYLKAMKERGVIEEDNYSRVSINVVDNESYIYLKNKYNIKKDQPILINYFKARINTEGNKTRIISTKPFKKNITKLNICNIEEELKDNKKCLDYQLNNIYNITEIPLGFSNKSGYSSYAQIIVNEKMASEIYKKIEKNSDYPIDEVKETNITVYLKVNKYDKIEKEMNKLTENSSNVSYYNVKKMMKQINNMVLAVKIFFYGFITLVTLIGVTSVINTINTSISLRRKEFAVLRSIGLTPKGFNKMIIFESIYFGIKSLLIGIPIGLFITYLFHKVTNGVVESSLIIPFKSIIIAIIFVFVIILLTMKYATSKIKNENILEAIREDNI